MELTPEQALAEALGSLPTTQMEKLAASYAEMDIDELQALLMQEKVAYIGEVDSGWLDQFAGTPFFDKASQLQTAHLQHEIEENQNRMAEDAKRDKRNKKDDAFRRQGDQLRTAKKGLELELALHHHTSGGASKKPEEKKPGPSEVPMDAKHASIASLSSPEDKIEMAEIWGRELAHTHYDAIVKEAANKEFLEKISFSITEKGHKFDTEKHTLKERQAAELGSLLMNYNALGHLDPKTHKNPATIAGALRFNSMTDPRSAARHHQYVAKEHSTGHNAWNPLGGALTPSKYEEGGTGGFRSVYGKLNPNKGKEKKSSVKEFLEKTALSLPTGLMSGVARMANNRTVKGAVGAGAKGLAGASLGKATAIGAGVGALGGAAKGAIQQPQPGGSRLGGAIRGAAGGAAVGAGAGAGLKSGVGAMTATKGGVGNYMKSAVRSAGGTAANPQRLIGA